MQLAKAKNAYNIFLYVDIKLDNVVIYLSQSENDNINKEFIDAIMPYNPRKPCPTHYETKEAWDTSNKFYHYSWGTEEPTTYFIGQMVYYSVLNQYIELRMRNTTQVSSHSVHSCKSGLTTHVTCGYVRAFNGIAIDNGLFKIDLIITDMHSYHGDSGDPVYFYSENLDSVSINGILFGGIQTTNSSNDITAILPLDIILSQVKIKPILSL
ncbi:hypothetical protein C2G38_2168450 [Gigaspora rosea]|uniref:Peptidase S1 domain-containing protein n=1 Tax=Gigaspora rosea TaxID=44941 RepID=A0A397VRR1_9GLOM|nr:hypothetical protein C2G38_2168450 [Gigaspora rosea]